MTKGNTMCWFVYFRIINNYHCIHAGRHGGLMISALISRSSVLGLSPSGNIALCSWVRHLTVTFIVRLSTQVCKEVLVNLMLGVTLRWTNIPSRGA